MDSSILMNYAAQLDELAKRMRDSAWAARQLDVPVDEQLDAAADKLVAQAEELRNQFLVAVW